VCSDGSQYRFWYYDSPTSTNMVISYEGGGACWDYASCSGQAGILGAAHPNGIPTDYITSFEPQYVSPIINGADPGIPGRPKNPIVTNGWDMVYMPYCTGDVHVSNRVVTYTDPTGVNPPIVFRHNGYNNTIAALNFLHTRFPSINKLLVTGFSAGGVASGAGFYFARRTLVPTKAYLLNDSGPMFPAPNSSYASWQLHQTIKAAWNRTTIDTLELSLEETLPAYRHVCRDEQYKNKAIVHQSLLALSRFPPQTLILNPFKHDSFMRVFPLKFAVTRIFPLVCLRGACSPPDPLDGLAIRRQGVHHALAVPFDAIGAHRDEHGVLFGLGRERGLEDRSVR
jgi:hypothetical protein